MQLRFSHDIKVLLEKLTNHQLTLSEILETTSERGFSLIIGLLVLPFLFPMPPGVSTILGSACLVLSVQMALGRQSPWLPKRMAQFRFPKILAQQLLNNLKRVTRLLERLVRPRWSNITEHPYVWQINGLCITWLTLLLMTPIPMTNPIPTVGILLLVVAMLEADGVLMCISYGLTALITGFFGLIVYLLWRSPAFIQNILQ